MWANRARGTVSDVNFVADLQFAKTARVAVEVDILGGAPLLTGVHDVNEEAGFVSLYAPTHFGDLSTKKVDLELTRSVSVTDIAYEVGDRGT